MGRLLRFRVMAALAALVLCATAAHAAPPVMLSDFGRTDGIEWSFSEGSEFPGAGGGLSPIRGRAGRGRAIAYAFPCADDRPCGRYVAAVGRLRDRVSPPAAGAISFSLDAPNDAEVLVRLTDETGRTFQYPAPKRGWLDEPDGFRQVVVPFAAWANDAWGGRNGARFTGALTDIAILVHRGPAAAQGLIRFDDVALIDLADNAFELRRLSPLAARLDAPAPAWGVAVHDINDGHALTDAQEAGFAFVRTDLFWHNVELSGGFNFDIYDRFLNAVEARNMGALFILDYWHDAHGGRAGIESGAAFPAFEAYARVSAAHYRDRNVVFEIWNEPDVPERMTLTGARFAELVAAGVRGLRAGDPSARVITGGLSYVNLSYAQAMLPVLSAAPERRALMGFGMHYYRGATPETAYADDLALEAALDAGGFDTLPIWNTEWGYSSASLNEIGARQGHGDAQRRRQAVLAVRTFLSAWAMRLPTHVWYDLVDDGADPREHEHNHGLLDVHGARKPAYHAVRAFTRITEGARLRGFVRGAPPGLNIARFDGRDRVVFAVWAQHFGGEAAVSIPSNSRNAYDMFGEPIAPDRNPILVREADGPVYIVMAR
ncbi:MAG: cellulase family glycosylhydrolase [Alphaproteobacteria bacterium]|nr:cellulase family glycosylhydrolase [Alphaproteobacteria bacterium]